MFCFERWPLLGHIIFAVRCVRHELKVNPTLEPLSCPDIHLYTVACNFATSVVRLGLGALNPAQTLDCFLAINPRLCVRAMNYNADGRYWVLIIDNLPIYTRWQVGKIFMNRDVRGFFDVKLQIMQDVYDFVMPSRKIATTS